MQLAGVTGASEGAALAWVGPCSPPAEKPNPHGLLFAIQTAADLDIPCCTELIKALMQGLLDTFAAESVGTARVGRGAKFRSARPGSRLQTNLRAPQRCAASGLSRAGG